MHNWITAEPPEDQDCDNQQAQITNVLDIERAVNSVLREKDPHHYLGRIPCSNLRHRDAVEYSHRIQAAWATILSGIQPQHAWLSTSKLQTMRQKERGIDKPVNGKLPLPSMVPIWNLRTLLNQTFLSGLLETPVQSLYGGTW